MGGRSTGGRTAKEKLFLFNGRLREIAAVPDRRHRYIRLKRLRQDFENEHITSAFFDDLLEKEYLGDFEKRLNDPCGIEQHDRESVEMLLSCHSLTKRLPRLISLMGDVLAAHKSVHRARQDLASVPDPGILGIIPAARSKRALHEARLDEARKRLESAEIELRKLVTVTDAHTDLKEELRLFLTAGLPEEEKREMAASILRRQHSLQESLGIATADLEGVEGTPSNTIPLLGLQTVENCRYACAPETPVGDSATPPASRDALTGNLFRRVAGSVRHRSREWAAALFGPESGKSEPRMAQPCASPRPSPASRSQAKKPFGAWLQELNAHAAHPVVIRSFGGMNRKHLEHDFHVKPITEVEFHKKLCRCLISIRIDS